MNSISRQGGEKRVLVALDAYRENHAVLEFAARLAANKRMELVTLFIEDLNLIHMAGLPFVREIDPVSAAERELDSQRMLRTLKSQIEQARRAVMQISDRLQLQYTFTVMRGHFMVEAVAAATDMDILFLDRLTGKEKNPRRRFSPPRLKIVKPPLESVWVLYDGTPASERTLQVACDLAQERKAKLLVLLMTKQDSKQDREKINDIIAGQSRSINYAVHPVDENNLSQTICRSNCDMFVLSRDLSSSLDEATKNLLEQTWYPVVLTP